MDLMTVEREVILETKDLTKRFGGLTAVNKMSFKAYRGEILGVIGPNGAGKSTLFNLMTGFLSVSHGQVIYQGRDVTGLSPDKLVQMGMVRTFQLDTTFRDMTVLENVLLACYCQAKLSIPGHLVGTHSAARSARETKEQAIELLRSLGMGSACNSLAGALPHGLQRFLGLAMALATNPKVLLVDEPLTGLNETEIKSMLQTMAKSHERGVTIILIEHNVRAIMNTCDRVVVMNFGEKIAEGVPREIGEDPKVINVYLGEEYVT